MFNKIPLFFAYLDKQHYINEGRPKSCTIKTHPYINLLNEEKQERIKKLLNDVVDIMLDNLNVEEL